MTSAIQNKDQATYTYWKNLMYKQKGNTDPRWSSFQCFFQDMGVKPPDHALQRKDTSGNFNKENCVWEAGTRRGKQETKLVAYGDGDYLVSELAEKANVSISVMRNRLHKQKMGQKVDLMAPLQARGRPRKEIVEKMEEPTS